MSNAPTADMGKHRQLMRRLSEPPVEYRSALAVLDPDWVSPLPEGKPEYELHIFAEATVLNVRSWGVCLVVGDPTDDEAMRIAELASQLEFDELHTVGDAALQALRRYVTDGRWQMSRQYTLSRADFAARPSEHVRKLGPEDRGHLEKALENYEVARHVSTIRDFGFMAEGRPVICWGAFIDGGLVGFCSTNPIYTGITEISWIFAAEPYRRRGLASGLLTAACEEALAKGDVVGYFNGGATNEVYGMVTGVGFRELRPVYRFIPSSSEQWRCWGRDI